MTERDRRVAEALDRLVPRRIERAEWDDVLSRLEPRRRRRPRVASAVAVAAVAAGVALVVGAPWRGGPSIVERAGAAIAAPPGQVIYEETRFPASGSLCFSASFTPLSMLPCPHPTVARTQLWVESGTGRRSFRSVTTIELPRELVGKQLPIVPFGNGLETVHSRRLAIEEGGVLGPVHVSEVLFHQLGQRTLTRYTQRVTAIPSSSFEPVALVRDALRAGRAHVEGAAVVRGRRVVRIALSVRDLDGRLTPALYDVDPVTFAPVELVGYVGFPFGAPGGVVQGRTALRFVAFRSLPATPANLALTSIRAQHPHARIVCGVEFALPDC